MISSAILYSFLLGFGVKFIASLDDTIVKLPVISTITRTRTGKVAFALGNLLAVVVAVSLAAISARFLGRFEVSRFAVGILILLLAGLTLLDLIPGSRRSRPERWPFRDGIVTSRRFLRLILAGFIVSLITLIDDIAAILPLFLGWEIFPAILAGILVATILHLLMLIFFSDLLDRLPRKREIAAAGLGLYGALIMSGIL
ncbi:hypothetical protein AMJ57_03995 [Parcubacteria bacterium SG8_24]|nr:MAG: hypothetical protein AMJ57_03995 [Parcubacteria bacterium SG8_24]